MLASREKNNENTKYYQLGFEISLTLSSNDYSVVYCLDDAVCNKELLIFPSTEYTNHEICQEGHQLPHPKYYLSNFYFECILKDFDLIQKYRKLSCGDNQIFYPNIGSCQNICSYGNIGEVKAISEDDDNCTSGYLECQQDFFWIEKTCRDGTVFSPTLGKCSYYCFPPFNPPFGPEPMNITPTMTPSTTTPIKTSTKLPPWTTTTQDDDCFKYENDTLIDGVDIWNQTTQTIEECHNLCCNLPYLEISEEDCIGFTWFNGSYSSND